MIAFRLIDTVESKASELSNQAMDLGGTITLAINSYEGVDVSISKRAVNFTS